MSYRDFQLSDVVDKFALTTREAVDLFADRPPLPPSALLVEILRLNVPIGVASGNEKARSEFIVAPVLSELKRHHRPAVGVFSGVDLFVDAGAGLTGTCDFLLSFGPEQLFVKAPIVALVEAKKDDLLEGMGQCAAEMVAARMFNQRAGNAIDVVHGAVTTGTLWRFMSLAGATLSIDLSEYHIREIDRILGILVSMTSPQGSAGEIVDADAGELWRVELQRRAEEVLSGRAELEDAGVVHEQVAARLRAMPR